MKNYWTKKCDELQQSLYTCPESELSARMDMVDDCIDAMVLAAEIEAECGTDK